MFKGFTSPFVETVHNLIPMTLFQIPSFDLDVFVTPYVEKDFD